MTADRGLAARLGRLPACRVDDDHHATPDRVRLGSVGGLSGVRDDHGAGGEGGQVAGQVENRACDLLGGGRPVETVLAATESQISFFSCQTFVTAVSTRPGARALTRTPTAA
jgi:hypothetical protein